MTTATAGDVPVAEAGDTGARSRLTHAVRGLATRASRADADRAMRFAGPVLLPTGAIVILLGWYGAAHTTRVFLQIPYLISGGLLGLGLMFAGGFLYFARWLTDLLDDTRRQAADARTSAERTASALERIEALLEQGAVQPPAPASSSTPAGARVPAVGLVATAKGSMAHRPDCRLVVGRDVHPVSPDTSMKRCQICRPPSS